MKLKIAVMIVVIQIACLAILAIRARYQAQPMGISVKPPEVPSVEYGSENVCIGHAACPNTEDDPGTVYGNVALYDPTLVVESGYLGFGRKAKHGETGKEKK